MANPTNWKAAQKKASSPEARAKAVATMKRRRDERAQAAAGDPFAVAALLKHAKMVTKGKKAKTQSIPLDMIPDREPKRKYAKRAAPKDTTRQEVVLALLKYLNGE